ncbi:MAG TPA: SDR family oxidoreductase [Actinocatenispora sp.]
MTGAATDPARGVLVVGASAPIGIAIGDAFAAGGIAPPGRLPAAAGPSPRPSDAWPPGAAVSVPAYRVAGVGLELPPTPPYEVALVADCATADGAQSTVDGVLAAFGRLDVVVLAAAVMPVAPVTRTTDAQWRAGLDATLGTAFAVCRAALPHLPRGAAIVAVSSVNATLAAPGLPAYAAAKAGLEGLVRQLALEYGPAGVRVNAVAPGMIGNADLPHVTEGYPLGRVGTPGDVAAAVAYLASDAAGFVTGAVLPVDGGLSIASPAAYLRPDLRGRFLPD